MRLWVVVWTIDMRRGVIAANSVGLIIEEYVLQRIFNNKYFGENTYKTQLNNIYCIMTNERDHPFYESVHTEYVCIATCIILRRVASVV